MTRTFLIIQVPLLFLVLLIGVFVDRAHVPDVVIGFLLSFGFVLISIVVLERTWKFKDNAFLKAFWVSMLARFAGIIVLLIIIYGATKIDEIYFTVSFIISYLCHSITEMIFINKILKKGSNTV